jgi:hypothetical protein
MGVTVVEAYVSYGQNALRNWPKANRVTQRRWLKKEAKAPISRSRQRVPLGALRGLRSHAFRSPPQD